jgi:hypothetical protein
MIPALPKSSHDSCSSHIKTTDNPAHKYQSSKSSRTQKTRFVLDSSTQTADTDNSSASDDESFIFELPPDPPVKNRRKPQKFSRELPPKTTGSKLDGYSSSSEDAASIAYSDDVPALPKSR